MDETFLGEDALHRRGRFFFDCSSIIYVVAASPKKKDVTKIESGWFFSPVYFFPRLGQ